MKKIFIIAAAAMAVLLTGCAGVPPILGGSPSASALSYTPSQAQQAISVQFGTVIAIQPVIISGPSSATTLGGALGALAGGYVGSRIGHGNGSKVAAVAGGIGGGIGGEAATGAAYRQRGMQITVHMDGGGDFAITQASDVGLHVGQRVEVVGGYGMLARVFPLHASQGSQP